MVAEEHGRVTVHVDVPDYAGIVFLSLSSLIALNQVRWYAMTKKMKIEYNVELQALSRAIGRAEWLAMG